MTNTVRRYSDIGEPEQTSRKRWVRSSALKSLIPKRFIPSASQFIAVLATVGTLGGCHQESRIPSRPPTLVRLAAVITEQTNGEALRYSASILPNAQVDLAFRTSGYVTAVRQVP